MGYSNRDPNIPNGFPLLLFVLLAGCAMVALIATLCSTQKSSHAQSLAPAGRSVSDLQPAPSPRSPSR
ncbi:MAG TPA: hypothetical protein VHQ47_11845 [Phycisphaerae bacterium]|nr:hypothetical protein [Phycisphaerae bacterium]